MMFKQERTEFAPLFRWIAVLSALSSVLVTSNVSAEDSGRVVEEIIVSATYRDTALLDTPIAITALDEELLIAKGVTNLQNLYQSVPGLSYRSNSNSYNGLTVRGLTSPGGGGSIVGVYIDDIPVTDANSGGVSQILGTLYDVQRVEVLKGPQGTLYGEGNMGGAFRFITNKADPNEFDSSFRTQVSDHSESEDLTWQVNGMINVPIVADTLALRVSGQYRDRAGFLDTGPSRNEDDTNFIEESALRAKLAWYLSDTFSIDATINYFDSEHGGPGLANIPYGTTDLTNANWENLYTNGGSDEQWQYNLSVNWELPWADFLSSTSYYERDVDHAEQTSFRFQNQVELAITPLLRLPEFGPGIPNPFYNPAFPTEGVAIEAAGGTGTFRRRVHRVVQEFRLVSTTDGPFQWTAGLYYKDDSTNNGNESIPAFGVTMNPGFEDFKGLYESFFPGVEVEFDNKETALYGEVSYDLSDQWNVLVGARFSKVEREQTNLNVPGVDDNLFSPKVTVSFRPVEDHLIYLTYAQGFRPGVINAAVQPAINSLLPLAAVPGVQEDIDFLNSVLVVEGDEVFNLELGYKASLFDGRLKGSAAIYYLDWKDTLQLQKRPTLLAPAGVNYNENAGKAHSQGIELEFDVLLTENLSFHFGGDYNHEAEVETLSAGVWADADGNPVDVLPGNRLGLAPETTFNMALDYGFNVGANRGFARMDWYRVSESFNNAANEDVTTGYHTVNARVGLRAADGRWSVSLFGDNLHNDEVKFETNAVGTNYGLARVFGLDFQWNLNAR